ncbi:DNA primase family protein [Aureimonas mangrovi]|uniref:DNA primase family protein n=1 Tax=Aureimonas mangrovi TaxID=2758041 RepID=UPI00163D9D99|nr:phage/plasmid primase, P4 family [Aureimonas mangrovi]
MTDDPKASVSLIALCAAEAETDIGNGRRLRHRHGSDLLAIAKIGWHGFDGLRWREDEDGSVVRPLAHKTAEEIRFECTEIMLEEGEILLIEAGDDAAKEMAGRERPKADAEGGARRPWEKLEAAVKEAERLKEKLEKRRQTRRAHGKSSCNSAKLDNMLKEAQPYLARTVDAMNTDPMALNCRNGTIRFVRIEDEESDPEEPRFLWRARLDAHRREDFITKLAEASLCDPSSGPSGINPAEPGEALFTEDALDAMAHRLAPTFIEFLHRVQPDIRMRAYLRRLAGYMLTGLTGEQIIAFFYGIGANGKSTFTDVLGKILSDYAVTLGIESFTGDVRRGGADATPDLARLNGAYACFASEGDETARLKEGLIKLLTGDDKIAVRKLHQDFVEITIKAKFVITGNHKPIIRGDDDGIWRRVHLFEWPVQIPAAERDRHLPDKLLAERDGILAWMLAGTLEYLTIGGLAPPEELLAAVQEHREDSDPVGAFIRGGCDVTGDPSDRVSPGELHEAYIRFSQREGLTPFAAATFNRRLPDKAKQAWKGPDGRMRQFVRMKSGGTVYAGIRIKDAFRGGAPGSGPTPPDREFAPRDE